MLGIVRQNYEQELDGQTILEIQKLWNQAGGDNRLLVESVRVVQLILDRFGENLGEDRIPKTEHSQTSLSHCSSTGKLSLTLKTRHNTSTKSIFDWSAADKENVSNNTMNNYVAKRVSKICSDFKKTNQKHKIHSLCLRDPKRHP